MIQKIKINRVVIFELLHYMRERDHLLISEGELSAWLRERDRERERLKQTLPNNCMF